MSHRPRKRFGQNFLTDRNIVSRMLYFFAPQAEDTVLEIGPGQAALSIALAASVQQLHLVEIDRDLAAALETRFKANPHVHVHKMDILELDVCGLSGAPLRVIGNIPYNITSPIIFHLLDHLACIKDVQLLMQKEVADRLTASAGTKAYGRMTVGVQLRCAVETLMEVPPHCFYPAPKVTSTLVRFVPHPSASVAPHDREQLQRLLLAGFTQRRKTLRNCFKNLLDAETLRTQGIDPQLRPDQLTPEQYARLSLLLQRAA